MFEPIARRSGDKAPGFAAGGQLRRWSIAVSFLVAMLLAPFGAQPRADIVLSLVPDNSTIGVGETTLVDLIVSGLGDGESPSLGGFQATVTYNPLVLMLGSVEFGSELNPFPDGMYFDDMMGGIFLFETSWLPSVALNNTQPGTFTLATMGFKGIEPGTSPLAIGSNTVLSNEGGPVAEPSMGASASLVATTLDYQIDGSPTITVEMEKPPAAIPLPATVLLMVPGLLAMAPRRRRVEGIVD